jgi:hypothetical protein
MLGIYVEKGRPVGKSDLHTRSICIFGNLGRRAYQVSMKTRKVYFMLQLVRDYKMRADVARLA